MCYALAMPSTELLAKLEEALDNPSYEIPMPEFIEKPKRGRPRVLSKDHSVVKFKMNDDEIIELDRKRGKRTRSEYLRELIRRDV